MRASEAEREAAVEELRLHGAAGRLDTDELEQRIEAAFEARTREQLVDLRSDLPESPISDFHEHLRVFAGIQLLLVAIWALTGAGYFWPVWPFMGWGIGVMVHWCCDRGREHLWASASRRTRRRRPIVS
jgi:hypothetical protein